jgi:hypothetical protein
MTNKKPVRKLFAVVALATATTAAPAVASPHAKHVEVTPVAAPAQHVTPSPVVVAAIAQVLALFGISLPRTLPTGAPACGNLGGKSQARADCERARR